MTQASRWSEVEDRARGVIIAVLDLDEDADVAVEIVPVFEDEAGQLLRDAEALEAQAKELEASASDAKRSAVRALKAAGWTLQGIAAGLGLSYQRIDQLLRSEGRRDVPLGSSANNAEHSDSPSREEEPAPTRSANSGRYVFSSTGVENPRVTVRESAGKDRGRTTVHRSAVTGRFVTTSTARRNPSRTVAERGQ